MASNPLEGEIVSNPAKEDFGGQMSSSSVRFSTMPKLTISLNSYTGR